MGKRRPPGSIQGGAVFQQELARTTNGSLSATRCVTPAAEALFDHLVTLGRSGADR
jgi:hypothetical protein